MNYPFTHYGSSGRIDSFQIQSMAEERFDNHLNLEGNDMATMKKATTAPATKPTTTASNTKSAPAEKPAEKKAVGAKKGPRVIADGFVGLTTLAKEFSTTEVAIRRKLRDSDLEKPEGGWVFKDGSKELATARKLLTPVAKPEAKKAEPAKK